MSGQLSKSVILTVAILCVVTGAAFIEKQDWVTAMVFIALGLGLIIAYCILLEKQAAASALRTLRRG